MRNPLRVALAGSVAAYLSAILLVPLGALTVTVLRDLSGVGADFREGEALYALFLSVILAAVSLLVNGVLGVVGGMVVVRQEFWGRRLLDWLVDLPLAVSPVMIGLAFLLMFGRNGWMFPVLDALGVKVAFAFPGLVVATLFVTLPFTVREVALVLEEIGTSEEEAAATLGATPWHTFWKITLPNLRHGLAIGATLTVSRALGEFGAVLVLGGAISGHTQTATTWIHTAMEERQVSGAYGMALVLAALATALLAALQRGKSRDSRGDSWESASIT
jgi:sulfate/thiosulfate transport system permease protein